MRTDFRRIAIVNRGEPAMRFIHAVREFNLEHRTDLRVVALFTDVDRHARFVREADEAVPLGAATFVDGRDGLRRPAYLDYQSLERVLHETGVDAVWAGWGFVAERPEFVELCERLNIVFIGPDSGAMRRLGDKICAKRLAEQAGIAVVPWGGGPVDTVEVARVHAGRLGYPVALKASGGAGGRGIRLLGSENELDRAYAAVRREASRIFNDPTVFVERWMAGLRHVEVQVQADRLGSVWAIGTRDCSVQRRFQKLLSEAPALGLGVDVETALLDAAARLVAAAHYRDQVSVEFLVGPAGQFWFLEANTRLQVEHVVTELTSGIDLVKLQLHTARGGALEGLPPASTGHAIDVRLNAEDPYNSFAASPGVISLFRMPTGPGLRVDTGMAEGDSMPAEFGSMFAKLAARGNARDEALGRLKRALSETAVVVSGGPTNRSFLLQLLEREEVRQGMVDAGWLDRMMAGYGTAPEKDAKQALLQAAIEVYDSEFAEEVEAFFASAARLRPITRSEIGRSVELSYRGHRYVLRVYRIAAGQYRLDTGGSRIDVDVEQSGPCERWLTVEGHRYRVLAAAQGFTLLIEIEGVPHTIARADEGLVLAASPAVVVSVSVRPGDQVAAGDRLAVLEAMKMEMPVLAPFAGAVRQVFVLPNAQVGAGTPLVHLDPVDDRRIRQAGPRVLLEGPPARAHGRPASRAKALLRGVKAGLEELKRPGAQPVASTFPALRAVMLGFDADAVDVTRWLQDYQRLTQAVPGDDPDVMAAEDELLRIFVDVRTVFGRQTSEEDEGGQALGSEQYLLTYLRTLDSRGSDLPPIFVDKLLTALSHYGVDGLEPGPRLRESLLEIFKANQRGDLQTPILRAVLQRRLLDAERLAPGTSSFLATLGRLIPELQGRYPAVADLARDVQYRYVEQPAFERVRSAVQADMLGRIVTLALHPGLSDHGSSLEELVECPQPLRSVLAARLPGLSRPARQLALEVMVRRDYGSRSLAIVRRSEHGEVPIVQGMYEHEGQPIELLTSCGPLEDAPEVFRSIRDTCSALPADHDVAVEVYLWSRDRIEHPDALSATVVDWMESARFDRPLRRTVVIVSMPAPDGHTDALHFLTLRPYGPGYREERLYRGLHPMLGKRLQLWRFRNFFLDRLPSIEDVYLFRGVARENPRDERLFALAEVRDATPLRDGAGRLVSVPHFERIAMEAFTAIRRAQLRRPADQRLHWNRVMLLVRPPLDLSRAELGVLAGRMSVQADALGLEKVVVRATLPGEDGSLTDTIVSIAMADGHAPVLRFSPPSDEPVRTLSDYDQKVVRMRQRGLAYPYEIVRLMTPDHASPGSDVPAGQFTELDLDADGVLVPVDRPYGLNTANIVVGVIRNRTARYPEGMTRVMLLGDPSREVGSLAEHECRRIVGAIDMADRLGVPVEWFALSAGAKISMESGTENMDWISRVLRRLIEFTQRGGEVNVIVTGINVGAQPYWNAEATMLMHTRGILVMAPDSAMVLTGKMALDYSGSVSASDNRGIGGYEHIMGPNGQAQYWAQDLREACGILMRHYDHCYVLPGERFPRKAATSDPVARDIRDYPHDEHPGGFATVGEVFSDEKNADRKRPFDIRRVMLSVCDQDHPPLERWAGWRDAEVAVTWDAHIGGMPVCVIGFESRPLPRLGLVPADGPEQWTSGTLFPMSSKKIARAINAASNNRPVVILANLSGFDGSPESMRRRQLEFGAEIGRAVVNFRGPIVFVVVSRYHGGAFVVFSRALNENLEVAALEGSFASVIGGAPAAAVVFAREVDSRTRKDARVRAMEQDIQASPEDRRSSLRVQLAELTRSVRSEKLGEVADEFDRIHSVHRALKVGSLDRIIRAADLRPYLADAIARGMDRELERVGPGLNARPQSEP